jgi:flagellin
MIIAHNMMAINSSNQLKNLTNAKAKITGKLSSGYRINKAADDAAGLSIREKMRAQIKGLEMADRNVQDGISLVQTADGALGQIQNIVQRQRELCVQAANDTLSDEDRRMIQAEIDQLNSGINEIANNTNFNQLQLLNVTDSDSTSLSVPVTTGPGNPLSLYVYGDGRYSFRTDKGYRNDSVDDNKILIYGKGSTSFPQVNIDGKSYVLRSGEAGVTITPTTFDGTTYKTGYAINSVQVTQSIQIVGADKNMYEIKYDVTNNDPTNTKNIGILFNVDTMLGDDDNAPFKVNGNTVINETQYSSIPSEFVVYNNKENPYLQAKGILTGSFDGINVIKAPDKFGVGRWMRVDEWNWNPNVLVGDSGYSLWWYPEAVTAGGSISVNTFFGVTKPTAGEIQSGIDLLGKGINLQVGANSNQNLLISRKSVTSEKLKTNNIFVDSNQEASRGIEKADNALGIISQERGKYGAYQNALEYISENVLNYSENLSAAESRISDTDMAKEAMENAKNDIMQQAAQAMLVQSNKIPNYVLTLLQ